MSAGLDYIEPARQFQELVFSSEGRGRNPSVCEVLGRGVLLGIDPEYNDVLYIKQGDGIGNVQTDEKYPFFELIEPTDTTVYVPPFEQLSKLAAVGGGLVVHLRDNKSGVEEVHWMAPQLQAQPVAAA